MSESSQVTSLVDDQVWEGVERIALKAIIDESANSISFSIFFYRFSYPNQRITVKFNRL